MNFTNALSFDQIEWEDGLTYDQDKVSYVGTMNQSQSLFDGVACNDGNYSVYASGQDSYISQQIGNFIEDITELTVELWFKRN